MTDRPRFSIVLPVHNRAASLSGAVASVLAQREADWELIVVDDASTDGVAEALGRHPDPRIRLVVRGDNGGVAAAQNTGLEACRGEFVAFLHSDDRFTPTKLTVQGAALAAAPPEVLAVESAFRVAGDDAVVAPGLGGVGFEDLFAFRTGVHVVPMLFRREAVADLRFEPTLRAWEDWDLIVRLLRRGMVTTTTDVVAEVRRGGPGRLVDSPWMAHGLEQLVVRYADDLAARPRVRSVWHLKVARALLRHGAAAAARPHFVRAAADDPRRAPLLGMAAATLLGARVARSSWRAYEGMSRLRRSAGRRDFRRQVATARSRANLGAAEVRARVAPGRRGPFRVHSFDVFDTVLTRVVAPPSAVFLLAGRAARRRGILDVTPADFARARVAAEAAARAQRPGGEVSLACIHHQLEASLAIDGATAARLLDLELSVERRVLRPVPGMAERIGAARVTGSAVAFVSDMYLDSDVVAERLGAGGLLAPGDHVLVSHEYGVTKAAGALYDVLLAAAGCGPHEVHHLGDNRHSDVVRARQRRLVATPFTVTALNRYEALLAAGAESTDGLAAAMAGASRLARLSTPAPTTHLRHVRDVAAGVAAPVLTAYVLWVLDQARSGGLHSLAFVSRDGQVLATLAESIAARLGLDIGVRYLYGGRQAWCLAGLVGRAGAWPYGPAEPPSWVLDGAASASAADVLARLGLTAEEVAGDLAAAGIREEHWGGRLGGAGVRRFEGLLARPGVRHRVALAAESAAGSVADYLRQEGLLDGPWGVVDLGWRGRATGAMAGVAAAGGTRPLELYLGLRAGPVPPGATRRAWLFESPARDEAVRGLPRVETLLEAFAAGDHGVVLGYRRVADRLEPVLRTPDNPRVEAWGLATLRQALHGFVDALELDEDLVDPWADLRPVAAGLLRTFWTEPTAGEARAWGAFPYEDDQLGTQWRLLGPPLPLSALPAVASGTFPEPHWRAGQQRASAPVAVGLARAATATRRAVARTARA